jgi:hypothetical protein
VTEFAATDERQDARNRELAQWRLHRHSEAMRRVLKSADGRLVIWDLIVGNRIFSPIAIGSSQTYIQLGQRSVALTLFNLVKSVGGFEVLSQMEDEYNVRAEKPPGTVSDQAEVDE